MSDAWAIIQHGPTDVPLEWDSPEPEVWIARGQRHRYRIRKAVGLGGHAVYLLMVDMSLGGITHVTADTLTRAMQAAAVLEARQRQGALR